MTVKTLIEKNDNDMREEIQGCIVNERKCKGRYECWKCPFATCNISFEVKDNKMKR